MQSTPQFNLLEDSPTPLGDKREPGEKPNIYKVCSCHLVGTVFTLIYGMF